MKARIAIISALAAMLAACAGGGKPAPSSRAGARPAASAPRSSIVVVPEVMSPQGLGGLIGAPAAALTRRFGQPRIDLAEGDSQVRPACSISSSTPSPPPPR
jgi:hypothetical protein